MVKKGESNPTTALDGKIFLNLAIVAAFIFILQGVFIFGNFFKDYRGLVGNIFIVSLSLLALIGSVIIYSNISSNFPREKKANLFLIFSLLLFLIGDIFWLVGELLSGKELILGNFPDLMWSLAYLFLIISLFYFISLGFRPSPKTIYLVVAAGLIIGGTILGLDIGEDLEEGTFNFSHAIQDSYILYDLVVLFMIIYLVWPMVLIGSRFFTPWFILGIGIISRLVYDQIFANMSQEGTYYSGHPVDLIYVLFYVVLLISFYFKSKSLAVKND